MGCPPKAQGRSGRAEQIQLQEVPGYSRHEPVEVQAQKFPTSQGRPWVEGGCGWGVAVEVLQASRGQEDRKTGATGGAKTKDLTSAGQSPVAGHGKTRFSFLLAAPFCAVLQTLVTV